MADDDSVINDFNVKAPNYTKYEEESKSKWEKHLKAQKNVVVWNWWYEAYWNSNCHANDMFYFDFKFDYFFYLFSLDQAKAYFSLPFPIFRQLVSNLN